MGYDPIYSGNIKERESAMVNHVWHHYPKQKVYALLQPMNILTRKYNQTIKWKNGPSVLAIKKKVDARFS
jgi:hypothetical protein